MVEVNSKKKSKKTKEETIKTIVEDLKLSHHDRDKGDGESVPETPPNEEAKEEETEHVSPQMNNPLEFQFTVDGLALILLALGMAMRMWNLENPRNVVFDEMHYGKYASMYLKRTFFFDANPPLGKMIIALGGYLGGYQGDFGFDKIGVPYPDDFPLFSFRFFPALFGSLLTPVLYLILCEVGMSPMTGALAGILFLLDTAFLTQSRYILLDSIMMFFAFSGLLGVLRMRQHQDRPYGAGWWFWLVVTSLCLGLSFSVKYLSFYSCLLVLAIFARDFWKKRLGLKSLSLRQLAVEFFTQWGCLTLIPALVYLAVFRVHLDILTKAGVHDSLMTSAFQASLEGGLSSIIKGQPLTVVHGSQVTLRHTHGRTCWIHSHEHVYPVRYSDGRGSSHQQQVSCYSYKDVNNWWIVKRPEREDLAVHEPLDPIKNGEVIQLVHGMTHRALNSHDVAAPMSPHNQEVTCYIDYNISMPSENLWRVEIINGEEGDVWHSINSQVRLIHVSTDQALKYSGKVYSDWGFFQNEVVCDKQHNQLDTVWNVEEHRYTKADEDKKSLEKELFGAELIPESPTTLSFQEKFVELQIKMLITNQENVQNHNYASDPFEWPFLTRGIAYFISRESNAQIHLLGNAFLWYTGTLSITVFSALLIFYLVRRRRLCFDIPESLWLEFIEAGEILMGGYCFHYLPFFFVDRTLFLHHYLPAYGFKILLVAFVVSHLNHLALLKVKSKYLLVLLYLIFVIWLLMVARVFYHFSVLSYGFMPLTADEVKSLKWKETWDLIIHKP